MAAKWSIYASLTSVILDEKSLRDKLGSSKEHGTRTEEIKKFFEEKGLTTIETENQTIEDIKKELGEGRLCLVVYQAAGQTIGLPTP